MILSYEMFLKLRDIVQDDCLNVDTTSDDDLILAYETGRAAGILQLAREVYFDLFGKDDTENSEESSP